MNKPSMQQRRAQSRRDKKRNAQNATRNAPLARSQSYARPNARMNVSGDKLTITHTEIVDSIDGQTAFTVSGININPGLPAIFPWGSQIALAYDYYVPKKVTLTLKSSLPATEPGIVFMYADSDVFDDAPVSMVAAAGSAHFRSASVWAGMTQTYPAGFFHTRRMFKVRGVAQPAEASLDDYDCAKIWVGSEGLSGAKQIGYLTITYEFELHNPTVRGPAISGVTFKLPLSHYTTAGAGVDAPIDLRNYVVSKITGKPPVNLEEGQSPVTQWIELSKPYVGTISAAIKNLVHNGHTVDRTMIEQDAVSFSHAFTGDHEAKPRTNVSQFVDALATGFHSDLSAADDFFLRGDRGLRIQPRLRNSTNWTYEGSLSDGLSEITYLFNAAKDIASFL